MVEIVESYLNKIFWIKCVLVVIKYLFWIIFIGELLLIEWEYLFFVGLRLLKGFVGLKNVGVICYMNLVL